MTGFAAAVKPSRIPSAIFLVPPHRDQQRFVIDIVPVATVREERSEQKCQRNEGKHRAGDDPRRQRCQPAGGRTRPALDSSQLALTPKKIRSWVIHRPDGIPAFEHMLTLSLSDALEEGDRLVGGERRAAPAQPCPSPLTVISFARAPLPVTSSANTPSE